MLVAWDTTGISALASEFKISMVDEGERRRGTRVGVIMVVAKGLSVPAFVCADVCVPAEGAGDEGEEDCVPDPPLGPP